MSEIISESANAAVKDAPAPLRFRGDWGGRNLTMTCGWLANWVWDQTPDHRMSVIHTGRGMGDNLRALAAGEVDVAVMTPANFAALAMRGLPPFEDHPMPSLRAIGRLPHRDAMVFLSRQDREIGSFEDLRERKPALRLSIGSEDRDGLMGHGARILLGIGGVTFDDIRDWGGTIRCHEEPFGCIDDLLEDRADAIIGEAIMTPAWVNLCRKLPLRFVSLTDEETENLRRDWDLDTVTIPDGYLEGMGGDVRTLDYAGWLVVTTSELPDETAALLARSFVENTDRLEMWYRHMPSDRSPLAYPITVEHAAGTSIPLHPGAERVYRAALASAH